MEKLILLYTPETAYFKLFRRLFARWVLFQIAPTNEFISLCQKNGHDPMYHAQADWGVSLARLDTKLQNRLKFKNTFFDISTADWTKSLLHKFDSKYRSAFIFAYQSEMVLKNEKKYIVAAPEIVLEEFKLNGFQISKSLSLALWKTVQFYLFFSSIKTNASIALSSVKDFFKKTEIQLQTPDNYWLGATPSEMSGEIKKLDLVSFIKSNVVSIFSNDTVTMIHYPAAITESIGKNSKIYIKRNPFDIHSFNKNPSRAIFKNFYIQICLFLKSLFASIFNDNGEALLLNDLCELPRANDWLLNNRPKNIIITNSWMRNQPIWFSLFYKYKANLWMFYYSSRQYSLANIDEHYEENSEPIERYTFCNRFAVWNNEMKFFLRDIAKQPESNIFISGPLIFTKIPSPFNFASLPITNNQIKIAIFDVSPYKTEQMLIRLGRGSYYYQTFMAKILDDCYRACIEVFGLNNFELLFKGKRTVLLKDCMTEYLEFLKEFETRQGVKVLNPELNPIHVIEQSHLVISAPFSTTTDLAHAMGRTSAYYDCSGQLQNIRDNNDLPELILNYSSLKEWLKTSLQQIRKNEV